MTDRTMLTPTVQKMMMQGWSTRKSVNCGAARRQRAFSFEHITERSAAESAGGAGGCRGAGGWRGTTCDPAPPHKQQQQQQQLAATAPQPGKRRAITSPRVLTASVLNFFCAFVPDTSFKTTTGVSACPDDSDIVDVSGVPGSVIILGQQRAADFSHLRRARRAAHVLVGNGELKSCPFCVRTLP